MIENNFDSVCGVSSFQSSTISIIDSNGEKDYDINIEINDEPASECIIRIEVDDVKCEIDSTLATITTTNTDRNDQMKIQRNVDKNNEQENNEDEKFDVQRIVGHDFDRFGHRMYDTQWVGFIGSDTWEPEENFDSAGPILNYFKKTTNDLLHNNHELRQEIVSIKNIQLDKNH